MTCKHRPGDPECGKHEREAAAAETQGLRQRVEAFERARAVAQGDAPKTPDAAHYVIEDVHREGHHLVLRVKYPNCAACAYEGSKVMVFLDVTEGEALRWKRIDPHFRDPTTPFSPDEAPSPAARFPASQRGWDDAIAYAVRYAPRPGLRHGGPV